MNSPFPFGAYATPMSLPRDLVEMLMAFESEEVRYLVIGGHAVSLHARPRSTKDLDLWLDPAADNMAKAERALLHFGAPRAFVDELKAAGETEIVWMGRAPARVDFLKSAPGVSFATAWARRVLAHTGGTGVWFIGREDLIANKRAVGRAVDKRDVRALEAASRRKS